MSTLNSDSSKRKIAFISGHMDITPLQFTNQYIPAMTTALSLNHNFVIGDAPGTDMLALSYLLLHGGPNVQSRITIYPSRPYNVQKFRDQGYVNVVQPETWTKEAIKQDPRARHLSRDKMMTENSDYDILWVMSEEEARALYGKRWRPRVSATEMNRLRRAEMIAEDKT